MRCDSVATVFTAAQAPVESAHAGGGVPAGPRQAAVGAPADADIDRAAYVDVVNRWFVAAMLGARTLSTGASPTAD